MAAASKIELPLVWGAARVEGACSLAELSGLDREHRLTRAVPLAAEWPSDVRYAMDRFSPKDMVLLDSVRNTKRILVVSKRLADFAAEHGGPGIEYLPVEIIDHKKRPVRDPYFILHVVGLHDCLDLDKCKPVWSEIATEKADEMKKFVLDPSKLPSDRKIFRPRYYIYPVLVQRALARAIDAAGFTGIRWVEPAELPTN